MCRVAVIAVMLLAGCKSTAKEDLRPFVAVSGFYSVMGQDGPSPAPNGKCTNCNGLGYLTDGTVRTLCPLCRGNKTTSGAAQCQSGTCRLTGR